MNLKRLNIKNKPFYLPTKLVNIYDFNLEKLEINKEGSDEIGIYYIAYNVSPFYLMIDNVYGYFEYSNDETKYLNLVFCDENEQEYKEVSVTHLKYIKIWEDINNSINKVPHNKFSNFNKDYAVIRFDSDDVAPFNKTVTIKSLAIVIRSVLESDGGYYL